MRQCCAVFHCLVCGAGDHEFIWDGHHVAVAVRGKGDNAWPPRCPYCPHWDGRRSGNQQVCGRTSCDAAAGCARRQATRWPWHCLCSLNSPLSNPFGLKSSSSSLIRRQRRATLCAFAAREVQRCHFL